MKKFIVLFPLLAFVFVACQDINLAPLEQRVDELEKSVAQIKEAQNGGDYITDITELLSSEGEIVGYQITFKEHGTVVVRNGAKGADGLAGNDGAPGNDGDAFFKSVTVADGVVIFETVDGEKITVPLQETFSFNVPVKDYDGIEPNQEISVPYTISGGGSSTTVSVLAAGGYDVKVVKTDDRSGNIVITAPALPADAQLLVLADNGEGKTGSAILNLTATAISLSVADFQLAAAGNGETLQTTLNVAAAVSVTAPEWTSVTVEGKTVTVVAKANPDAAAARQGKIILRTNINGEASSAEILIAQAAAGCKIAYDSFAGPVLNENWKGDFAASEAHLSDGRLILHGDSGDRFNPLFYEGVKIRRQAGEEFNTIICTVDIKADGAEAGIQLFNTSGYDGGAYNFDMPNYRYFISAGEGSDGGGFYGFNKNGLAAADAWTCLTGKVTEWMRLEISNVDHGKTGNRIDPAWGAAYIWSLEMDENGILQPKDIIWAKELWWWNDGDIQPRTDYGYAAVWGRSGSNVSLKNFTLSYTDK